MLLPACCTSAPVVVISMHQKGFPAETWKDGKQPSIVNRFAVVFLSVDPGKMHSRCVYVWYL